MTHPKDAIELVAAALAKAHGNENDNLFYGKRAVQVLDRIAPMLVAAEREACAKVADGCPDYHWGWWVACAIRARGEGGNEQDQG